MHDELSSEGIPYEVIEAIIINPRDNAIVNHIPSELFALFPGLRILDSDLQITEISANDLANANELRKLDISESKKLRKLTAGTFQPMKLEEMNMDRNGIDAIDDFTFANLTLLQSLSLRENKLNIIRRYTFAGISELTALFLQKNEIHSIENGAFNDLKKLQSFELSQNKLKMFSDHSFDGLIGMKWLYLNNNQIESIAGFEALRNISSLVQLDLRGNGKLTELDKELLRSLLSNLRSLEL